MYVSAARCTLFSSVSLTEYSVCDSKRASIYNTTYPLPSTYMKKQILGVGLIQNGVVPWSCVTLASSLGTVVPCGWQAQTLVTTKLFQEASEQHLGTGGRALPYGRLVLRGGHTRLSDGGTW